MEKQLYLVRHGELEWDQGKAYLGQIDLPLSEKGKKQARQRRDFFSAIPLDKAYTSPLKRCVTTLDSILENKAVTKVIVPALKEISMGDWEGRTFEEVKNQEPEAFNKRGLAIKTFAPPNGESFLELQQRVMPVIKKIANQSDERQVIICTHAGVIRVILTGILGLPLEMMFNWPIFYADIYELGYQPENEKWICKIR
ncbi:alpha-ribazole phosphatase [Acetobacterium woodii]|uniref:Alpha-ribazole phosphatase n=1 Tax=Acetobacterium woodii (strain ATCC 29683 / DSM 1030 / JCM 2381 / KCTC 1655 / WB1) TaxID=931626 RepID=H6LFH6_ACEWD|nr:alpha-ribazole phosphatase [Acetobacterium woodii]AFA49463.1 phosphoglycerate mutase Pgm4 [Acetobacterium woodii DSM 1030]